MRGTISMISGDLVGWVRLLALTKLRMPLRTPSSARANAETWRLDPSQGGIEVYTRPVTGSAISAFQGTSEFDHPTEAP